MNSTTEISLAVNAICNYVNSAALSVEDNAMLQTVTADKSNFDELSAQLARTILDQPQTETTINRWLRTIYLIPPEHPAAVRSNALADEIFGRARELKLVDITINNSPYPLFISSATLKQYTGIYLEYLLNEKVSSTLKSLIILLSTGAARPKECYFSLINELGQLWNFSKKYNHELAKEACRECLLFFDAPSRAERPFSYLFSMEPRETVIEIAKTIPEEKRGALIKELIATSSD